MCGGQGYGQSQGGQPNYGGYQPSKMIYGQPNAAYGSTAMDSPNQGYQGQTKPAMMDGGGFQQFQRFGSTQDLGSGMQMKQMGPSMMPWRNDPNATGMRMSVDQFPQRPGGMGMKQMGPSMWQPWMNQQDQKAYTPPPGGYTPPGGQPPPPITPPTLPPLNPTQPPGQPPPNQPPPTQPPPNQPQPLNPAQFPGVPQHILNAITTDPSGRMLYGPDKSPVKFEGGQMVFDNTPFVPGAGQFGQFGAPGAGGFRLDQSSGKNMILGGANGPQMYNAEGLVQGSQAPQNFVNYLNSYRR